MLQFALLLLLIVVSSFDPSAEFTDNDQISAVQQQQRVKPIVGWHLCALPLAAQNGACNCSSSEQIGQLRCAGCEPTCDNPMPEICTQMHCFCSCDCVPGMLRNSQTEQCVWPAQCQSEKN
ncbi:hypothetical protein niasHT_033532 [Heterodera trifolii]|uniref:TIL domain-containing protein n=1 Tax=Heterodera trifolii TaxID=157864 RepID=A0ABD2J2Z8_9BILA